VIDVLVVDDHRLVRAGLTALLDAAADMHVVGEAADGAQSVQLVRELSPDVVLMDLSMPGMDGVEATRQVLSAAPLTRVVVLTSFADRDRVVQAVAAGAVGYLLKDSAPAELLAGVRAAAQGHNPLDPRVAGALLPSNRPDDVPAVNLSGRERQVLRLAGEGLANKQIARALGIAEPTVKAHLANIYKRIGVSDRTSAALWAVEHLSSAETTVSGGLDR